MPTTARAVRFQPAAEIVCRHLNGGAVLIDLDTHRIFELNETGARVWECLRRGDPLPAQAAAFVEALRASGLVEARAAREAPAPDGVAPPWDASADPPRLRPRGTVGGLLDAGGGKLPEC